MSVDEAPRAVAGAARSGAGVAAAADVARVSAPTEQRNPRTLDIDVVPTLQVLRLINGEDHLVAPAVERVLPLLAVAVDLAVAALRAGHRVHYFGAGTSGRLGVLDAAELPPTYSLPPDRVVAHHAGGVDALVGAVEAAEDDEPAGAREAHRAVRAGDVVVGLTASGRTPYVGGALRAARGIGAATVLVSAHPEAPLAALADVHVGVDTGPEAVAGSTRMKAATAQKLVLNAFSTAVMVRTGRTWSNLMVAVSATNAKLRGRLERILAEATGLDDATVARALTAADGDLQVALVSLLARVAPASARAALDAHGSVREAVAALAVDPPPTG